MVMAHKSRLLVMVMDHVCDCWALLERFLQHSCVRLLGSARAIPAAFFEIEKATMVKAYKSRRAVALRLLDQDSELKMVMMCCGDQFASVFLPTLLGRQ